jgi:hypothetical protein
MQIPTKNGYAEPAVMHVAALALYGTPQALLDCPGIGHWLAALRYHLSA